MSTATGWTHTNACLALPQQSDWRRISRRRWNERFGQTTQGRIVKGDSDEQFKQPARIGCNRTSRKTCRKQFKKQGSKLVGRFAKESESGRACGSIWSVALYRSR